MHSIFLRSSASSASRGTTITDITPLLHHLIKSSASFASLPLCG